MMSCNFDLFHMSVAQPAFWDWLHVCFINWSLYRFLTWWLWKSSPPPVWNPVFVGCLYTCHMKVSPMHADFASNFLGENFAGFGVCVKRFAVMEEVRKEGSVSILKCHFTVVTSWNRGIYSRREKENVFINPYLFQLFIEYPPCTRPYSRSCSLRIH